MDATRWYMLRHPDGFEAPEFAIFQIRCQMWSAELEGYEAHWQTLDLTRDMPAPAYEIAPAIRSADRTVVTLALGGTPCHGALKLLEDEYPELLYQGAFPLWFALDLEFGRKDTLGWFPQVQWRRVMPEREAAELRNHPLSEKPERND